MAKLALARWGKSVLHTQHQISISVVGGFDIAEPGGDSLLPKGRKTQGILAFLASQAGRPARRSELIGMFWKDRGDAQGKASLRQSLHELKASLGPKADEVLAIDRQSVALLPENVAFDLWSRDGTIRSVDEGPFLKGLDAIAPDFDNWLSQRRQEIRSEQLALSERELGRATLGDDTSAILAAARRVLRLDPRSEMAAKAAMRIHASRAENTLVLKVFEDLSNSLAKAGFQVSDGTKSLFEELRSGRFDFPRAEPKAASRSATRSANNVPVVAVPPFNILGDACNSDFSHVMADDVVAQITRIPELRAQSPVKTQTADYILNCSVTSATNGLRCAYRITHRASGVAVHSDRKVIEDSGGSDFSSFAQDLSTPLAGAIERHEFGLRDHRDFDPQTAYDHFLLAKQALYSQSAPGFAVRVRELLEESIKLDSRFEPAYDLLIQFLASAGFLSLIGQDMKKPHQICKELSAKLLSLNFKNPNAHISMGWSQLRFRNYSEAERHAETAMELGPYDPIRLNALAHLLVMMGRFDEGELYYDLASKKMGQNLDFQNTDVGELCYLRRDFETALKWLESEAKHSRFRTLFWRMATFAQLGRLAESKRELDELEYELERRWCGPERYKKFDGIKWFMGFMVMKRQIDTDVLLDGLAKAGLDLDPYFA